jgi:stage II sporulation protein D
MKRKRKMISWMIKIPLILMVLIGIILWKEPEREGITRAAAYKSAALSLTTAGECRQEEEEADHSFFPIGDQEQWYVKYMDYLYRHKMISEEMTPALSKTAEGRLTYEEAAYFAEQVSEKLAGKVLVTKRNRQKPFPEDEWWELYEQICQALDNEEVKEETLVIYGTLDTVENGTAWTVYTDQGEFGFEGLGMSKYVDTKIRVLERQGEIIRILEKCSDDVVYKNIWISEAEEKSLTGYVGSVVRELPSGKKIKAFEDMEGQVADVYLSEGQIKKVVLKKERISGKVLAVKEDGIEIEGYGEVPLDESFQVYKVFGDFERQAKSNILVGYDCEEFVTADGKLCAALIVRPFEADTIRVLLMDTNFSSIFHDTIQLEFQCNGVYVADEKEYPFYVGDTMTLTPADSLLKKGRIVFKPEDKELGIKVLTMERSKGIPTYPGNLEIVREEDSLVLINELYLENYLKRVVPSEMPASYEKEALKAQAVCARTYAYRQIQGNSYRQYGAHVDDSTKFQVYNNLESGNASDMAVNETYGKLLLYQGQAAEAFYFSTSCGHTTDGTIWGADISTVPYLKGVAIKQEGGEMSLTSNEKFSEFIKGSPKCYESDYAFYRWNTKLTSKQLEQKIPDIGTITKVTMKERSTGGIGSVLLVEGTEKTKEIRGEGQIRATLGNTELVIEKQDGSTVTGWASLPSSFISIECGPPDENQETVFTIYGGGYGHGVGMSQNGAQAMAKAGKNYREILEFFYQGATVGEMGSQ